MSNENYIPYIPYIVIYIYLFSFHRRKVKNFNIFAHHAIDKVINMFCPYVQNGSSGINFLSNVYLHIQLTNLVQYTNKVQNEFKVLNEIFLNILYKWKFQLHKFRHPKRISELEVFKSFTRKSNTHFPLYRNSKLHEQNARTSSLWKCY